MQEHVDEGDDKAARRRESKTGRANNGQVRSQELNQSQGG